MKRNCIIRIEFQYPDEKITMLFGNSYKNWDEQVKEYIWDNRKTLTGVNFVTVSNNEWIGWGGLKWCSSENFQQELNREDCQDNEPDNPNPRRYSDMRFDVNEKIEKEIMRIFNEIPRRK
ncbi:MAG: hypothetical protein WC623_24270 [Pedobacter sp.]|uniref:hypothetical protein n=1 Tax=Pedobacter sp. TaxID=1411316 RepID=UPI0035695C89